ncbi:putative integral membrane protein [Babesia bovis T2Bo]|uniref:Membrane protein, putative n=1 Tax=Babesia bovis TaxID=5865 RepID=A7AN50_BABBO|nr:putative integral membrane protein [Babesia bovis T2Bo]EDO07984.1 putative integral membrane protein [Babesia bovis T2Bo]|eukprot:XP_001611552.1 membrane protein [Babesia bovis T2Bo]
MYLSIFIPLCVCVNLADSIITTRSLLPQLHLKLFASKPPVLRLQREIETNYNGLVHYPTLEYAKRKRLWALRSSTYRLIRNLFSQCLDKYNEARSIEDLYSSVLWSKKALESKLYIFRRSPIVFLLLFKDVSRWTRRLFSSIQKRCHECTDIENAKVLQASPRLSAQYKLNLTKIHAIHDVVTNFVKTLGTNNKINSIRTSQNVKSKYWNRVHLIAYRSGIAVMLFSWCLVLLNRIILPYLMKEVLALLCLMARRYGIWIPSDFITVSLG